MASHGRRCKEPQCAICKTRVKLEKRETDGKKINDLINIVDLFNLIRLLNYEIENNYYYLSDLSYCGIYNNYLSDLGNYGLWSISVLIL